ncbi:MAG: hypothetical protein ACFFCS_11430 [Candidatus Hodarchaeota archaeon]
MNGKSCNFKHKHLVFRISLISLCVFILSFPCILLTTESPRTSELNSPGMIPGDSGYYTDHLVDSVYASYNGTITNFANLQDYSSATSATFTADSNGIDIILRFSGVNQGFTGYSVMVGVPASQSPIYISAGESTYPTASPQYIGLTTGLFQIDVTSPISGTDIYVRFYTVGSVTVNFHSCYLRNWESNLPVWDTTYMPSAGQWYSSNPSLYINFTDDTYLAHGYYDLNDYATSTDTALFINLHLSQQSTWLRTSWIMSTPNWNGLPQGSNTLYFLVEDCAENQGGFNGAWSWQFNKDTVAPPAPTGLTSSTHTTSTWSSTNIVNVSWSEPNDGASGSGIAGYSTSWSYGGGSDPGTSGIDTTSLSELSPTLSDSNSIYFNIRARDNADLWSSSYSSLGPFYIDANGPSAPAPSSSSHTEDVWSNNDTVTVDWLEPSDGSGSGVDGYSYSWTNATTATPDTSIDTSGLTNTTTLADGMWYFNIRAIDNIGHAGTSASSGQYLIDTTGPTDPSPQSTTHTPYVWSNVANVTVNWTHSTDHGMSGVDGYSYHFTSNSMLFPDLVVDTSSNEVTASLPTGIWYFDIVAIDNAGNPSLFGAVSNLYIDVDDPILSSPADITLDQGTTGESITWTLSDYINCTGTVKIDGAPSGTLLILNATDTITESLDGLEAGTYQFQLDVTDLAGNNASDTVIVTVNAQANVGLNTQETLTMLVLAVSVGFIVILYKSRHKYSRNDQL